MQTIAKYHLSYLQTRINELCYRVVNYKKICRTSIPCIQELYVQEVGSLTSFKLQLPILEKKKCYKKQNDFVYYSLYCTVVDLSTRTAFLNIDQSLQFRNFWSQSKALFMVRCILSVGSGSNTFGALKVTIYVKFFELSVYKMSNFLRISAC